MRIVKRNINPIVASRLDAANALSLSDKYSLTCDYLDEILAALRFFRDTFKDEFVSKKAVPDFVHGDKAYPLLSSLLLPIGMIWGESTGYMPTDDFGGAEDGHAPERGTCSAFVVDCFRATGWTCSNADLAHGFREMLGLLDVVLQQGAFQDEQEDAFGSAS